MSLICTFTHVRERMERDTTERSCCLASVDAREYGHHADTEWLHTVRQRCTSVVANIEHNQVNPAYITA